MTNIFKKNKQSLILAIARNKFIFFLLAIVFLLRIPSLFEPYWYGDEGIYLTLGLAIKKGLLLYRDIYDNKPPLIYLIAAVANGEMFWFRTILMVSVLATLYFFYQLSLKIFSDQKKFAKTATILLALGLIVRLIEGNIANAEIFILLPTTLGFYLVLSSRKKGSNYQWLTFFGSGLILSLGFLLKIPAVLDFLALICYFLFFEKPNKFLSIGKREILLIGGYLLPIFLTFAFFWSKGTLKIFYEATIVQTLGYVSSWKTGSHSFSFINLLKSELMIKAALVFVLTFLLWLRKKSLDSKSVFIFIWFLFALFSATLSGRPYPHYLIQVLPPFALSFGLLWTKAKKPLLISCIILLITGLAVARYRFWSYTTISYWQNFSQFIFGQKDKKAYFSYFNPDLPRIYSLAESVLSLTQPEDKIFVWADEPYLYALSKKLPPMPYTVAYHIIDLNRYSFVIQSLRQKPPKIIIINKNTKNFPELNILLKENYFLSSQEGNLLLFIKRNNP